MENLSPNLKNKHSSAIDNQQDVQRRLSIQRLIESLAHAHTCENAVCSESCQKMKRVIVHIKSCKRKTTGGCPICKQLIALCYHHAKHCQETKCLVPYCANIKHKLKIQMLQSILEQAQMLRNPIQIPDSSLKIFIKLYTGKVITVNIQDDNEIKSIKKIIQDQEDIPEHRQRLLLNRKELDDNKSLKDYKICNLSTISCESKIILIKHSLESMITVPIEVYDTADILKQKIQDKIGISKNNQRLFFSSSSFRGKQLIDSIPIFDNNFKGQFIELIEVDNKLGVFVEILEDKRSMIYVPINLSDTVTIVKQKIEEKISKEINGYKLFFLDNELADDAILDNYGIENESCLQLCPSKIIYIKKRTGHKRKLEIERCDTIETVKKKIKTLEGVDDAFQNIYFEGNKLEDLKTLAEHNIGFGMNLELRTGKIVYINMPNIPQITLELMHSEKIKEVKESIEKILGFSAEYQEIKYNDIILEDHNDVEYYNIAENSNLYLNVRVKKNIQIFVCFKDKKETLEVDSLCTIKNIKDSCQSKFEGLIDQYDLYYNDTYLNDNFSLRYYEIKEGSTIYLLKNENNMF